MVVADTRCMRPFCRNGGAIRDSSVMGAAERAGVRLARSLLSLPATSETSAMRSDSNQQTRRELRPGQAGKAGWILLWLVGVPIPILLILFVLRGCT